MPGTSNTAIRLFAGLRYASVDHTLDARYLGDRNPPAALDDIPAGLPATLSVESKFSGVGVRVGASGEWVFARSFTLFGTVGGSMLVGDLKTKYADTQWNNRLSRWDYRSLEDQDQSRLVTAIDGQLGVNWSYVTGRAVLDLALGCQFEQWLNVASSVQFPSGDGRQRQDAPRCGHGHHRPEPGRTHGQGLRFTWAFRARSCACRHGSDAGGPGLPGGSLIADRLYDGKDHRSLGRIGTADDGAKNRGAEPLGHGAQMQGGMQYDAELVFDERASQVLQEDPRRCPQRRRGQEQKRISGIPADGLQVVPAPGEGFAPRSPIAHRLLVGGGGGGAVDAGEHDGGAGEGHGA